MKTGSLWAWNTKRYCIKWCWEIDESLHNGCLKRKCKYEQTVLIYMQIGTHCVVQWHFYEVSLQHCIPDYTLCL